MQEDDLDVDVLPVLVQEVLEEVGDGLVGDVAADHNVPVEGRKTSCTRYLATTLSLISLDCRNFKYAHV